MRCVNRGMTSICPMRESGMRCSFGSRRQEPNGGKEEQRNRFGCYFDRLPQLSRLGEQPRGLNADKIGSTKRSR